VEPGLELWRNAAAGIVAINRIGEYGRTRVEVIHGDRTFHITPQERRMNQNVCARPELDFFTNGTLQPVVLLDDEEDTAALRQNPNVMAEADIEALFKIKGEAFAERLDHITNTATLGRLVALAREPRLNATVQQYELVKARQRALETEVADVNPDGASAPERRSRAVTPK
jgi:hypothetical protein